MPIARSDKWMKQVALLALFCLIVSACQPKTPTQAVRNIMGMEISFDVSAGDLGQVEQLMTDFGKAFALRDRAGLIAVTTSDFVWYQNTMVDGPQGRAVQGVDALLAVLEARQKDWSDVRYTDNHFYATAEKIIHTYHVTGTDLDTGPFEVNGMDIYTIRDGKIAVKDSYWKRD